MTKTTEKMMTNTDARDSGYVYFNPDTGEEFSFDHPVRSGECPDASRIRRATDYEVALRREFDVTLRRANEAEDNLRLSSDRAKDMYAALKNAVEVWGATQTLYGDTIEQMKRALAKAEGRLLASITEGERA